MEAILLNLGVSIGGLLSLVLAWFLFRHLRLRPSNERFWVNDNARMATADFDGDKVTIRTSETSFGGRRGTMTSVG